jgi:hypothetical protein
MQEFVVLSKIDINTLRNDKPVTITIDHKHYTLCTDEYFENAVIKNKKGESK